MFPISSVPKANISYFGQEVLKRVSWDSKGRPAAKYQGPRAFVYLGPRKYINGKSRPSGKSKPLAPHIIKKYNGNLTTLIATLIDYPDPSYIGKESGRVAPGYRRKGALTV